MTMIQNETNETFKKNQMFRVKTKNETTNPLSLREGIVSVDSLFFARHKK